MPSWKKHVTCISDHRNRFSYQFFFLIKREFCFLLERKKLFLVKCRLSWYPILFQKNETVNRVLEEESNYSIIIIINW